MSEVRGPRSENKSQNLKTEVLSPNSKSKSKPENGDKKIITSPFKDEIKREDGVSLGEI